MLRSEWNPFRLPMNINAGRSTLETSLYWLLWQRWLLGLGQWHCFWGMSLREEQETWVRRMQKTKG